MLQIFNGSNLLDICDTVSKALNSLSLKNLSQTFSTNKEINIEVNAA